MLSIEQIYRHDDWWDELNFSQLERNVRQLQGRIYRDVAEKAFIRNLERVVDSEH